MPRRLTRNAQRTRRRAGVPIPSIGFGGGMRSNPLTGLSGGLFDAGPLQDIQAMQRFGQFSGMLGPAFGSQFMPMLGGIGGFQFGANMLGLDGPMDFGQSLLGSASKPASDIGRALGRIGGIF